MILLPPTPSILHLRLHLIHAGVAASGRRRFVAHSTLEL